MVHIELLHTEHNTSTLQQYAMMLMNNEMNDVHTELSNWINKTITYIMEQYVRATKRRQRATGSIITNGNTTQINWCTDFLDVLFIDTMT
jgi:hypothetical protein